MSSRFERGRAVFMVLSLMSAAPLAGQLDGLHDNIRISPESDWILPADLRLTSVPAEEPEDRPVTVLLMDAQVRLPKRGPHETYTRQVYRINSRSVLEDFSSEEIEFEPSYQSVSIHHVKVYRDGVWVDRIDRSRCSLLQREQDLSRYVFDQRLSALILMDDIRVGDVVSVAYTVAGANPIFAGRYADEFYLGWDTAVERRRLRLLAHEDREIGSMVHGMEAEPEYRRLGEWVETTWDLYDLPLVKYDFNVPYDWVIYPWIQLSEWKNWSDVARWAVPLYERADERPDALIEIARSLPKADARGADTVIAARNWVQDEIRYLAVVMDGHSHAPHPTTEVLRRRYGDCKDKTVLLMSLLGEIGVSARPALVNSVWREAIRDWLPSPNAFDHVIVAVGDGEPIWVDPTLVLQGYGGEGAYVPPYGASLIVEPGTTDLTPIPPSMTDPGSIRASYEYDATEGGGKSTVKIVTEYKRREAEEMRTRLASTSLDQLLEDYVEYYSSTPGLSVTAREDLTLTDDRVTNTLSTVEFYDVTQDLESGSGVLFRTLDLLIETALLLPEDDRNTPLALPYPLRRSETLELVTGPDLRLTPVNKSLKTPWFLFSAKSRVGKGSLRIDYELETFTDRVEFEDLQAYRNALNDVSSTIGYEITLLTNEPGLRNHAMKALGWCAIAILSTLAAASLARRRL